MYNDQNQATSMNTVSAKPQPEMAHAAQVLESSIIRLEQKVSELVTRLAPVIEDRPQKEGSLTGRAERQMFSQIGRGIMETSYRIDNVERRLDTVIDTLAI